MEVVAIARAGCESLVVVVIVVVVSLPLGNLFLHYRSLCVCLKVQRESYLVKVWRRKRSVRVLLLQCGFGREENALVAESVI